MSKWRGIEEFVAVATTGSFRAAADQLSQSTSQVSRAVQDLENQLQTSLFFRSTRVVSLTDAGRSILDHCRQLILDRDDTFSIIDQDQDPRGELRITCSSAIGERFIAPVVREFAQDFPDLTVSMELSNRLVDLIGEGFDLAIRTGHLEDSGLLSHKIAERKITTCAAPAYLDAYGTPDSLVELSKHNCLIGTAALWRFVVDGTEQSFKPTGRWRANSGHAVLDAALAGMGICQLPDFYVAEAIEAGDLVPILVDSRPSAEPIWAVFPQRRHRSPKVYRLVDRLQKRLVV